MEVCYAYDGIGRVIMEMTASDWAAWVGAVGTAAAAWLALSLYSRSRRDAQADAMAKRKVLHYVLREYVIAAGQFVRKNTERLRDANFNGIDPATRMALLAMDDVDRLTDLQLRLLDFGEEGDAEIAAFIESCRRYEQTHHGLQRHITNMSFWEDNIEGMDTPIAVNAIRNALERVAATVDPALVAIERFDKR